MIDMFSDKERYAKEEFINIALSGLRKRTLRMSGLKYCYVVGRKLEMDHFQFTNFPTIKSSFECIGYFTGEPVFVSPDVDPNYAGYFAWDVSSEQEYI